MVKPRIVETNAGIQDEQTAAGYDKIMRTDRVLKPGGKYYISDLVREMNPVIRYFMKKSTKSPELVSGLISSPDR